MGDSGASGVVGGFVIIGIFVAAPILIALFVAARRRGFGRASTIIGTLVAIPMIPLSIGALVLALVMAKAQYEVHVHNEMVRTGNFPNQVFQLNNITYEIPAQRSSGLFGLPDGSGKFDGDPLSFTEKNGILTIENREVARVKVGDRVKIDKSGTVFINGIQQSPR